MLIQINKIKAELLYNKGITIYLMGYDDFPKLIPINEDDDFFIAAFTFDIRVASYNLKKIKHYIIREENET